MRESGVVFASFITAAHADGGVGISCGKGVSFCVAFCVVSVYSDPIPSSLVSESILSTSSGHRKYCSRAGRLHSYLVTAGNSLVIAVHTGLHYCHCMILSVIVNV